MHALFYYNDIEQQQAQKDGMHESGVLAYVQKHIGQGKINTGHKSKNIGHIFGFISPDW